MNILSIDTSGKSFSLTLQKDNIKTSFVDTTESVSSESVLVEIDKLVSECMITPKDICSVIYNNGPGSFTGVRVSSAIVQAIGFSNNCPVYGINSLMLIAYSEYMKNNVSKIQVIKKAFGDQVFHGLFHLTSDSCISNDPIKTSTFSDVEIDSNYVLITDDNNTIEISSNHGKYALAYTEADQFPKTIIFFLYLLKLAVSFTNSDTAPG